MAIVTGSPTSVRTSPKTSWQQAMRTAVRDPLELCRRLNLPRETHAGAVAAAKSFGVFVPLDYLARIRPGDPHDPLLRQVLPLNEELEDHVGFEPDPVRDAAATVSPGLLHKYPHRALIVTTGACAVHCRYCFRRHFPYSTAPRSVDEWIPAIAQIAQDESLEEVILSGGDPLTLVDSQLARLAQRLADVPHIMRLRVHTRLPVMIPERVTDELIAWLRGTRLVPIVVIHANHARELDEAVAAAVGRIVDAGIPVLNQSVLLRGVNDKLESLVELSRSLVNLRVTPYYLHQLDRVTGAAHFDVPIERGKQLVGELRHHLPGYAIPHYVQDLPGYRSKTHHPPDVTINFE